MHLRELMLNPDEAPVWLVLLVLAPLAVLAAVVAHVVRAPWWTVPIPLGVAAAFWQFTSERLRARGWRPAD